MPHDADGAEVPLAHGEIDLNRFANSQCTLHHRTQTAFADVQAEATHCSYAAAFQVMEPQRNTE